MPLASDEAEAVHPMACRRRIWLDGELLCERRHAFGTQWICNRKCRNASLTRAGCKDLQCVTEAACKAMPLARDVKEVCNGPSVVVRIAPAGSNAPIAVHARNLVPRLLAHNMAKDIQHGGLGLFAWLVLHVISNISTILLIPKATPIKSEDRIEQSVRQLLQSCVTAMQRRGTLLCWSNPGENEELILPVQHWRAQASIFAGV